MDQAPRESCVVELPPEANVEMSPVLGSTARSAARDLELRILLGTL